MTKAQRILDLYKTGKYTTRQIADVVGCLPAYVRVAARQRKGSSYSEHDERYFMKRYGGRDVLEALRNRARAQRATKRRAEARAS